MDNEIFVIKNNHVKNCGEPPITTNNDPKKYYGYYENMHGEQWIFVYDYSNSTGELRGGDVGWENIIAVKNGLPTNLILGEAEIMWLQACWKAVTAFTEK